MADNPYRRRLEDIDPARKDPSTTIEHVEPPRRRPNAFTVEGFLQGVGDIAEAAVSDREPRRSKARVLAFFFLLGALSAVGLGLLGLSHVFG
jgi:hypothetical protein